MSENPVFGFRKEKSEPEGFKIPGIEKIKIVDQMKIPAIKGVDEETRKEINWFNSYTPEEFNRAAYITSDNNGHRYYWDQGAILKP